MISKSSDSKILYDLWKVKEEAYNELNECSTLKEKISKRIKDSHDQAKKIQKLNKLQRLMK